MKYDQANFLAEASISIRQEFGQGSNSNGVDAAYSMKYHLFQVPIDMPSQISDELKDIFFEIISFAYLIAEQGSSFAAATKRLYAAVSH